MQAIATDCNVELESRGSLTLCGTERAAEPDSCFYIGNNARVVRSKDEIDLANDPPPDIVAEVDIQRARLDKRRIYAGLRVPEFWRYDGKALAAYRLSGDAYIESATSVAFPSLAIRDIETYVNLRRTLGQVETIRRWHNFLRAAAPQPKRANSST